jgi:hypothetical protein
MPEPGSSSRLLQSCRLRLRQSQGSPRVRRRSHSHGRSRRIRPFDRQRRAMGCENLDRQLIEGLDQLRPRNTVRVDLGCEPSLVFSLLHLRRQQKPFVTSMTILPDQSCRIAPTSLNATAPTTTRMISAATASSIVTAWTLPPSAPIVSGRANWRCGRECSWRRKSGRASRPPVRNL